MVANIKPPTEAELKGALGTAFPIWAEIISRIEATHAPIVKSWKASKSNFGRMCLLQRKKRTLLYITPDQNMIWIAIVLGERAFQLAMAGPLPDSIKHLLLEAKPYTEGRGIRFVIRSLDDIPSVLKLLEAKTAVT